MMWRDGLLRSIKTEKKRWIAAVVVELLLFAWLSVGCIRPAAHLILEGNVCWEKFSLAPGSYEVTIRYQSQSGRAETDQRRGQKPTDAGALVLQSELHLQLTEFPDLPLQENREEESQRLLIHGAAVLKDLSFALDDDQGGNLWVEQIEVREYKAIRYLGLLSYLLAVIGLDLLCSRWKNWQQKKRRRFLLLGGLCLLSCVPFLNGFAFTGHDTTFHLNRIVCLADELRQGHYFPVIYATALNGYGYANPLFYSQTFLYLPAVLYVCGCSLTTAYNIYSIVMTVGCCLAMYYCVFRITRKDELSLLAAALYVCSVARLDNVLVRGAVGEFTAQVFLPLIVVGCYNVYHEKAGEKIPFFSYLWMVVGLTGVIQSHVLTFLMCGLGLTGFCLLHWRETFQRQRILALGKAALVTLVINLGTILPFVESYGMDLVVRNRTNYIQGAGVYLLQLLCPVVYGNQGISTYQGIGDEMPLGFGGSLVLGLLLGILCLCQKKEGGRLLRSCVVLTVTALFLSSVYMPYDSLDALPKTLYQLLTVSQFPWRWMIMAALFGSLVTVLALDGFGRRYPAAYVRIAEVVILVVLVLGTGQIYADQMRTSSLDHYAGNSYTYNMDVGNGEYLPEGTVVSYLYSTKVRYDRQKLEVSEYQRAGTRADLYVRDIGGKGGLVRLPMLAYDNYQAYAGDGSRLAIRRGSNNQITIEVPPGYDGRIRVDYQIPVSWKIAYGESLLMVIVLGILGMLEYRGLFL